MVGHLIERAAADDAVDLVDLRDRIARWLTVRGIRQWRPGEFDLSRMRAWVDRGAVDVCRETGTIVAAVAVLWDDPTWPDDDDDAGYIHLLMVDRRSAGRGLGDVMLAHAERRIRRDGRGRSRLDAVSINPALHRWYRRRGYVTVGTVRPGRDRLTLFEKRLRSAPRSPAGADPA